MSPQLDGWTGDLDNNQLRWEKKEGWHLGTVATLGKKITAVYLL